MSATRQFAVGTPSLFASQALGGGQAANPMVALQSFWCDTGNGPILVMAGDALAGTDPIVGLHPEWFVDSTTAPFVEVRR